MAVTPNELHKFGINLHLYQFITPLIKMHRNVIGIHSDLSRKMSAASGLSVGVLCMAHRRRSALRQLPAAVEPGTRLLDYFGQQFGRDGRRIGDVLVRGEADFL